MATRLPLEDSGLKADGTDLSTRIKVRRRQWQFIRRQGRFFLVTVVGATALTSLLLIFIRSQFLRGFVVGVAVAGTIGALAMLVMLVTGTAPISMGATAEQWSASEPRLQKKAGWRVMKPRRPANVGHRSCAGRPGRRDRPGDEVV